MNIQIFGRRDCSDTRKAERYFKERRIPFQFIDLKEKAFAKRELETVARAVGWDALLDRGSARFKEKGLSAMSPGRVTEVLLADSLLAKTPVVRDGSKATVGYRPEVWTEWAKG